MMFFASSAGADDRLYSESASFETEKLALSEYSVRVIYP
jgi:hypothetical protein